MLMTVVDIRIVRMTVRNHAMRMLVRVGLRTIPLESMFVLMMRVMHMRVTVSDRLVRVAVFVPFCNVQPKSGSHGGKTQPE